jgi:general secretion pathway protein K
MRAPGLEYALYRLQPSALQPPWLPDGRRYRWQFDTRRIDLRIVDENGKINLNLADTALLDAFLRAMELEPGRARQLAGAIADWRDADSLTQPGGGAETPDYQAAGLPYGARNSRFETLGELQRVLGMDAKLYERLEPMLTLYSRQSRPGSTVCGRAGTDRARAGCRTPAGRTRTRRGRCRRKRDRWSACQRRRHL